MKREFKSVFMTALLVGTFISGVVQADAYKGSESYLTGDWGGNRTALLDAGIDVGVVYTADYWNVMDGGIKEGSNLVSNLDVQVDIDGYRFYGLKNNTVRMRAIYVTGGSPNAARLGSVEGIDNFETDADGIKLYEFWTEQKFMQEDLSLLLGLYDVSSDFANTEMTSNFMKPSMRIMPTLDNSGGNGLSSYPDTGLSARVKYVYNGIYYAQAALVDGVPGNANNSSGTHIHIGGNDGALMIAEAGITPCIKGQEYKNPNKLALGVWRYTEKQDDMAYAGKKEPNQGVYVLGSYEFYGDGEGRSMGAFVKGGMSDEDTHQVDFDMQTGIVGKGFIPTRKQGEIGVGYTQADNSDDYMKANPGVDDREFSLNTYYRDEIVPGVNVQPEFQYIKDPGSNKAINSSSVFGLRVELNM